jgi:hypothetical protein
MKKLLLSLALAIVILTGCASGGAKSFSDAHESVSKSSVEKTKGWVEVEKTKYAAIGSAALKCESDACRMGMAMAVTAVSGKSEPLDNKQPTIVAPVDPAIEVLKIAKDGVLGFFGMRLRLGESFLNAIRPGADAKAASEVLRMGDVISETTIAK